MKKDLLKLLDLSSQYILTILDTADQLKAMKKAGIQHPFLAGKTLAMIFEKSSTRTRVSFETGMYQLGGNAIYLSDKDSQIGRNEPVEDTARVRPGRCGDPGQLRLHPRDQRPDRLLPPLPGAGRSHDHPGAQGQAGRPEAVLHR